MSSDMRSFMERCMADEIHNPEATILDEIDIWHAASGGRPLHDYLGLALGEYRAWVENRATVVQLVERRKAP